MLRWTLRRPFDTKFCSFIGPVDQWCRRRGAGGASTPPKVLIGWKSGQNPWKSGQKWRTMWFDLNKMAPNVCRVIPKEGLLEKMFAQSVVQVWENSGKNASHPKNLPAPTPVRWTERVRALLNKLFIVTSAKYSLVELHALVNHQSSQKILLYQILG